MQRQLQLRLFLDLLFLHFQFLLSLFVVVYLIEVVANFFAFARATAAAIRLFLDLLLLSACISLFIDYLLSLGYLLFEAATFLLLHEPAAAIRLFLDLVSSSRYYLFIVIPGYLWLLLLELLLTFSLLLEQLPPQLRLFLGSVFLQFSRCISCSSLFLLSTWLQFALKLLLIFSLLLEQLQLQLRLFLGSVVQLHFVTALACSVVSSVCSEAAANFFAFARAIAAATGCIFRCRVSVEYFHFAY